MIVTYSLLAKYLYAFFFLNVLMKTVWSSKMSNFVQLVVQYLNAEESYNSFLTHTSWTVMWLSVSINQDQYFLNVDL